MPRDLAIVLNNGGVNSAVVTALAAQKFRTVLIYCDAENSPQSRSLAAFEDQVSHFKPYREHTLSMPMLHTLEDKSSADRSSLPADPRVVAPIAPILTKLLPIVATGAAFAAHYDAAAMYVGLRVGPGTDELARATEYMQIWGELLAAASGQLDIDLTAPLLELDPWQVIDVGFQTNAPLDRTWSCIADAPEPCRACRNCRDREAAFVQAGKADPLRIVAVKK